MTAADYDRLLDAKDAWWQEQEYDLRTQIDKLRDKICALDKLTTSLIIPLARRFPTWNFTIGRFGGTKTLPEAPTVYIFAHNNMNGILVWQNGGFGKYLVTICGAPHDLIDWDYDAREFEILEELYDALQNVYARLW